MSGSIPLIRSAAIAPMLRWLSERGRDPAPLMVAAGLGWFCEGDPFVPIPLRGAVRLLVEIARLEGPDAPYRIVDGRGGYEIGLIGAAALQGPTVRTGLRRISRTMPDHCTHELFTVSDANGGIRVSDGWAMNLGTDEVVHVVQQYVAGLVDMICGVAGGARPSVSRVSMVPHPEVGLSHLHHWLGDLVCASRDRSLEVMVDKEVADRPIPAHIRIAADISTRLDWPRMKQGTIFSEDVVILIKSMLPRTKPTVDDVAAAAGSSARTVRRRLHEEGQNFSDLVESTRARIAVDRLTGEDPPTLRTLSKELAYANQATLTRAVRRWTGMTPRAIRGERCTWLDTKPAGPTRPG